MADRATAGAYRQAARTALELFPIEVATCEPVAVSENVTFRVTGRDGDSYALRLHRPGYNSLRELESERAWCAALADAGLQVQEALASKRGRAFEPVAIAATGERRFAGVTTWFPGRPLSAHLEEADGAERRRSFHAMGRQAAALHNQSSAWRAPEGFERPRLDEEGLLGEAPRWGRFWEHRALSAAERASLLAARNRLRAALADYGRSARNFGLIHADMHPENIIVSGRTLGLIDFDDCAWGWHGYDLASALIEEADAPDFEALRAALLDGYRERRALTAEDLSMLDVFILLRGMALLGWYHQRPDQREGEFFDSIKALVCRGCAPGQPSPVV